MELIRIGDKIINKNKILSVIDKILKLRQEGFSQKDTAGRLELDRSFVSRLESLGEIRKGKRIAVIGFPILNKAEIEEILKRAGVDFVLLMSEAERWKFVKECSGIELFNKLMELAALVRTYDTVVFIGSNRRIEIMQALLGKEALGIVIGQSPIAEDIYVDPKRVLDMAYALKNGLRKEGSTDEAHCQC